MKVEYMEHELLHGAITMVTVWTALMHGMNGLHTGSGG